MTARLEQLWAQLVDFFRAQPPARRIVLIATGVGSLTAVLALAWWVQRPLYRPLFTNLAEQDASAIVEALRAEKAPFRLEDGGVTVVDQGGRMLTTIRRGDETDGASSGALEMQTSIERQLAERVESMLAAVVGRDKAVARVAATLDFARVDRTEETYDPERTALRTQRTTREQTTGARTGGGAPGVRAKLPNEPAAT